MFLTQIVAHNQEECNVVNRQEVYDRATLKGEPPFLNREKMIKFLNRLVDL